MLQDLPSRFGSVSTEQKDLRSPTGDNLPITGGFMTGGNLSPPKKYKKGIAFTIGATVPRKDGMLLI